MAKSLSGSPRATTATWIFNFESSASLLLALGSLLAAWHARQILPANSLYRFWESCLLPVQLPVFYFGYGYLYQRQWRVTSPRSWWGSVRYELANLLTPLAFITVLTLAVRSWLNPRTGFTPEHLAVALFVDPVIPVGFFLVALVFYLLIPNFTSKRAAAVGVGVSLLLKIAVVIAARSPEGQGLLGSLPYVVANGCDNALWFCGGMALALEECKGQISQHMRGARLPRAVKITGPLALWLGLALGCWWLYGRERMNLGCLEAVLVGAGLGAGTLLYRELFGMQGRQWRFFSLVDGYTKGIWLLHPLCLELWFYWAQGAHLGAVGTVAGSLAAAYLVPVAINVMLDHLGRLGFLINPNRYLSKPR